MEIYNLITVLGWEDRFLDGINIIKEKYNLKSIILITFSDYSYMDRMEDNRTSLQKITSENKIELLELPLEYNDSINNWKKFNEFFNKNIFCNVIINLTTIPRETIWTLLFYLKKNNNEIKYVYFKPNEYNKGWLTKNHKEPRLLFKHSGIFDLEKKLALLVITGFDESRLIQLVEYYEPSKLIVFGQIGEQFDNLNRNKSIIDKTMLEIEQVEIDAYDIESSLGLLSNYIDKNDEYNIILASQGPKTSSISTYKCYLNSSNKIALAYVPARDFNNNYSNGINKQFITGIIKF